ncbi:hypothetical protein B0P06_005306 [Clostridium saccharoperbutylacetonicum]|uniref:Putative phage essential recombination function protein n=1 Tax=Clostridium saccharoperbutylacetonicum N1-4(HMT) TaxID=931276 RepID=M1MJC7_9CLOT|nr:ERF family protein [Clostridium saccharoperbutylacetonicum]AGF56428.1 putative phage essential recombination function protein [Clostridium saccharoperbutylacetonicum N1-4(HMT)]NRT62827.1 hypothetical protein [Clostridium saccharoperbutylacetonicum]NSB26182.1 hypothetical protein [Clostridium saccharoperbutylacetonicum]NSB45535.1 hypothetical protein [Clostridium saccharoperbutylacetonicum]
MAETIKNIYSKMSEARGKLQEVEFKKSAYNSFSKYYYFDLSDILPPIMKICDEFKLTPIFNMTKEVATLRITNAENTKEEILCTMPVGISPLKGCNDMQSIGGAQTFAQKYLYSSAFGISETDATDKQDNEEGALEPISNVQVKVIESLLKETGSDRMAFLAYARVKDVKEIVNRDLPSIMNMLDKKKEEVEAKKHGGKESGK